MRFRRRQASRLMPDNHVKSHGQRVTEDLKKAGVSRYGLNSMEGHYISNVIHPDEKICGAVFGHSKDGYALLVATDSRVIFLDNKPFFINKDEVTYGLVGGISCGKVGPFVTVTLHTKLGDFQLRSANYRSVRKFIDFIEHRCLEHKSTPQAYKDDFSSP